MKLNGN